GDRIEDRRRSIHGFDARAALSIAKQPILLAVLDSRAITKSLNGMPFFGRRKRFTPDHLSAEALIQCREGGNRWAENLIESSVRLELLRLNRRRGSAKTSCCD